MSNIHFFILYIFSFSFISSNNDYNKEELNSIINEYESNISQAKLISCINLLHSFLSQRDGDQKLKSQIKSSQFPHDKYYIKFITASIQKCYDKINNNQVSYLLTQENTDNYNTLNSSITNLIKIEEINNVDLTDEEQIIYDKISTKFSDYIPSKKNKKKNKGFFEEYKILIMTGWIILGGILFYLRYFKDSEPKKKTKISDINTNKKHNKRKGKK